MRALSPVERRSFRLVGGRELPEFFAAGTAHGPAGLVAHAGQSMLGPGLSPLTVTECKYCRDQQNEGKNKGEDKSLHRLTYKH